MILNPPQFRISNKCCEYAKKKPANAAQRSASIVFIGIRKYEGGARSLAYESCFHDGKNGLEHFPLFFWKDEDKEKYCQAFGVEHSDAYTKYGCKRTGCAGCPFGSGFEKELDMLKENEPQLYKVVNTIFGKSYEYTRKYRKFREECKAKEKAKKEREGK